MESKPRILVVDDEESIVDSISFALEREGYEVQCAGSAAEALKALDGALPDLVLLDVMLPDRSGLDLCTFIRFLGEAPILMLSARDSLEDKVQGLEAGADDYLVKPFKFKELLARVRALMRRWRKCEEANTLQLGDLKLEPARRTIFQSGEALDLTLREFELLEYFMRRPRRVVTRDELLNRVWHLPTPAETNVLEVHISSLRQKLRDPEKKLIRTIRGVGYTLGG
ncbi:response regulator transcription factor [bacterium]|nr:response regulator transcription factor [bacterium]